MRWAAMVVFLGLLSVAAYADSLFSKRVATEGTLVSAEKKKFNEGDLVTVLVREQIDATTASDTDTKKESDVSASAPVGENTFFIANGRAPGEGGLNIFNPEELPNWGIEVENEHKTSGKTARTNKLITTIGCTVTKVHENGNIDIEGTKRVTVNREDSTIVVKGTVRSRDVTPANTVNSTQLANAVVELKGKGPLWNNQRRGLLTKILDWFSPF